MKKSELLELLKDVDDNSDINETIQGIEGLAKSSKLDVTKLTVEDYKNILENNDVIKGYNTSQLDSAISKAIASHDKKFTSEKLPKIIEEELKKRTNDGLTPEQIEIKELKESIEAMKKEKEASLLLETNRNKLKEAKLTEDLAKYVKDDNDIEFFKNLISKSVSDGVQAKIKNSSYNPPANNSIGGKITWNDVIENPSLLNAYNKQQEGNN